MCLTSMLFINRVSHTRNSLFSHIFFKYHCFLTIVYEYFSYVTDSIDLIIVHVGRCFLTRFCFVMKMTSPSDSTIPKNTKQIINKDVFQDCKKIDFKLYQKYDTGM